MRLFYFYLWMSPMQGSVFVKVEGRWFTKFTRTSASDQTRGGKASYVATLRTKPQARAQGAAVPN
jgi:hypothetical protein